MPSKRAAGFLFDRSNHFLASVSWLSSDEFRNGDLVSGLARGAEVGFADPPLPKPWFCRVREFSGVARRGIGCPRFGGGSVGCDLLLSAILPMGESL